jgi:hypothetical protein
VVEALRVPRDQQSFERIAAAGRWIDSCLVFVSTGGTPLDPCNVLRIWYGLLAQAGLNGESSMSHATRRSAC